MKNNSTNHPIPLRKVSLITGFVVVIITLSCSVGVLTPSEPLFKAPDGVSIWTATPELVSPTSIPTPVPGNGGSQIAGPISEMTEIPTAQAVPANDAPLLYYTQAGDTLPVVSVRFGVKPDEVSSPEDIPDTSLMHPNQLLIIPNRLVNTTSSQKLLPDSEIVFSPSAADFDVETFVNQAGGYLSTYDEWLGTTGKTSGADIISRIALENSINPRILLALLEYQSGWVYGNPSNLLQDEYPLGKIDLRRKGLYLQLAWAVNQLSIGYYGWREGLMTDIQFSDGVTARLAPDLNAGSVALQYYFTQIYDTTGWVQALNPEHGFPALYERMYGNPWMRALDVEPLYPPDLTQPTLILPFLIGQIWSYSGGPHGAWEHDGARAALDFAPGSSESGCVESAAWAVASAPGLVVRANHGVVVLDLDGDGFEQTGWVLLYLHVSDLQVRIGQWVETSDLLGHPSCEGGVSTGTHIHFARKYNGEWIAADGSLPFILNGWIAQAGVNPYEGSLIRDGDSIQASVFGSGESLIMRNREEP
jgi:murein DD-endopeptidase MepM/ murein hydrolase activator NlpD